MKTFTTVCRAGLVVIDGSPRRVEVEARDDGNIYLSGVQDKVEVELTGAGIVAVTGGTHHNDCGHVDCRRAHSHVCGHCSYIRQCPVLYRVYLSERYVNAVTQLPPS